jgi:hypothetical protein
LETDYQWYCDDEVDHYVRQLDSAEVARVVEAKRQQNREKYQYLSPEIIEQFAHRDAKQELGARAPVMTIEEFASRREATADSLLKPVAEREILETAPRPLPPVAATTTATAVDGVPGSPATDKEHPAGESAIPEPASTTDATPAIAEPAIDSAVLRSPEEPGKDSLPPGLSATGESIDSLKSRVGDTGGEIPPEIVSGPT